jgi:hypothetical protein
VPLVFMCKSVLLSYLLLNKVNLVVLVRGYYIR